MEARRILRLEGLAVGTGSLYLYYEIGGPLWLLMVLALAPDVSMVGYLRGPLSGARAYNAAHTYIGPLAVAAVGLYADIPTATYAAAVWTAHIGFDRTLGYGLKLETGFGDTHLSRGRPTSVDSASDRP